MNETGRINLSDGGVFNIREVYLGIRARLARKAGRARGEESSRFLELRTQNLKLRVTPVSHVLLVSLTIHGRRERVLSGLRRMMVSLRFEPVEIISIGHSEISSRYWR